MDFSNPHVQSQNKLSAKVYEYYNAKQNDRNLLQAEDGYVHHHFGLGPTMIDLNTATDEEITGEVQRQENDLADLLIHLLSMEEEDPYRLVDLGCGRGGTMFRILDNYPETYVDGVNLSQYQTVFTIIEANDRDFGGRCEIRQANFLSQPYPDETFDRAYCCEVTQYAKDLNPLFEEVMRVLKPGGRFAIATWCFNDFADPGRVRELVEPINDHYASTMHGLREYLEAARDNGFTLAINHSLEHRLIDYWKLRQQWSHASGVEPYFIEGHQDNTLLYHVMVFQKPWW